MADQALAVITPADAKARALALIAANKDAISFVRSEDLDAQGVFLPVVSVLRLTKADFHNLGGGAMMPRSHHVNRMAEYGGVSIHSVDVRQVSEFAWIGKAAGEKRMPDGTMRPGEQEYLYDAEKRAELDVLKDKDNKYTSEKTQRIHLLETAKYGVQRAGTGARLALVRFFCKTPTSFKPEEMERGMILSRIDVNSDALLAQPGMRQAAIRHALGVKQEIYGPERDVTPGKPAIAAPVGEPAADPTADDFDEPPAEQPPFAAPAPPAAVAPDPREPLRKQLAAVIEDKGRRDRLGQWKGHSGAVALDVVSALVADETATLEALQLWVARCAKIVGGVA